MMNAWLRRAGEGTVDGAIVRWSVAEGSRGRRWRWTISRDGALRSTTLLELDRAGRFARLEHETDGGMLTLHPEPDGRSVNGNRVRTGGVDHIVLAWPGDGGVRLDGDPFGSALCPGQGTVVHVGRDGDVVVTDGDDRPTPTSTPEPLVLDARGVPILDDPLEWPLEA